MDLVLREFTVIIERDEDGWFVADVPELQGCHTQGRTKQAVLKNIKEAIELCLEVDAKGKLVTNPTFVSVEKVSVHA
ncbi:MAG: type II toxin-antitoxin system HicB family antitoxin [Candidatus Diapherotrites archaeon]|nr:type II toxin-antitoxin system HicB family antitoxin [Candidatus Diapherotrites archaeon]